MRLPAFPWFRAHRASLFATALCIAPMSVIAAHASRQDAGLLPVTGHWTAAGDGGQTVFTVDGTKWSGTTDSVELSRTSTRLFGSVLPTFVANGRAPGTFPIAVAPGVRQFTNGTIRVRFKLLGGASDQNAGIVFGFRPDGEYHYLRYNTKDGDLALWGFADGARRAIAHGEARRQLALQAWHVLEVTLRGRELIASVRGDSLLQFRHTFETLPTGRVGLWVKRDAVTAFQDFTVSSEPAP